MSTVDGKGVWDGIGGMLKQFLRKIINGSQHHEDLVKTTSGRLASPFDCYEQLKYQFQSEKWKAKRAGMKKATRIREFTFIWAGPADIVRPKPFHPARFHRIHGIQSHYQYLSLQCKGKMAVRENSCWCNACTAVALSGPSAEFLSHELKCTGCKRGEDELYQYRESNCHMLEGVGAGALAHRAGTDGNKLASGGIGGGEWVLFEVVSGGRSDLWLGKTEVFPVWPGLNSEITRGKCAVQHKGKDTMFIGDVGSKIKWVPGDWLVAVRWYECVGERKYKWWEEGLKEVEVQHAYNLRLVNFPMNGVVGAAERVNRPRRGAQASVERQQERERTWELSLEDYGKARAGCIY